MSSNVSSESMWPWGEIFEAQSGIESELLPKISIITPSFNQGRYLEETIRSIIAQNYPNYELIIIDAGSTDNTLDVIRQYEPWITHWVSEPDRGQSHAIQKGLDRATGDIINWINSDDLMAPGAFYHIAAAFDLAAYDVICGRCDYFLDDINHLDLRNMRMVLGATVGETLAGPKINQPSTFFKASIIKALGIDEQFRYTMDVDLWYRYLLQAGQARVLLSDALLTYFRLHEASKSVAETSHFDGDIWKVYYNVLFSLDEDAALLQFAALAIPNAPAFVPTRYKISVPRAAVQDFVRYMAWLAIYNYTAAGDLAAVKRFLHIARRNGQPINQQYLRHVIKSYLLPGFISRWITLRNS